MIVFKHLATTLVSLILLTSWGLAAWSLSLNDFDAPDLMIFFGRFHPLVLHLPIGLTALALLLDLGLLLPERMRRSIPDTTWLHFLVSATAGSAVIHGILLYASGGYDGSELARRHLIGGCVFLTIATLIFYIKCWIPSQNAARLVAGPTTIISMLVLSISAHDGASLTHGESYLSQYAPEPLKPILEPGYEKPDPKPESSETSIEDGNIYDVAVQPIFNRICVQCHKESKKKGKLRMDSYEELMKGGAGGDVVEPGDVEDSYMIELMEYPLDDEERMPPEGKPQHTDAELAILKWWITVGAPGEGALKSFDPPAEILKAIKELPTE